MKLLIHGNDVASSRNLYFEEKNKVKNPIFLTGENITLDQVFQAAENKLLFDDTSTLLIENFFSKNKSNTIIFKEIVDYVNKNNNLNIVFWENSEVSKSSLSQLKNADIRLFSFPQNLFLFLDNLKPGNYEYSIKLFHELKKIMESELIFFMIVRQFRLLLTQIESNDKQIDEVKRLAPWQLSKFKKQANYFPKEKLIRTYNKLFEIDLGQKTGKISFSTEKSIDFFLLDL